MRTTRGHAAPLLALAVAGIAGGGAIAARELRRRGTTRPTAGDGRLIARWVLEEPWKGHWDIVERHVSSSYVGQDVAEGRAFVGRDGFRARLEGLVSAFPDGRLDVDHQVGDAGGVASRWTLTGTQMGELDGMPPSGKQITVSGITLSRLENDVVAEEWTSWDRLGLLVQLGAVAEPTRA